MGVVITRLWKMPHRCKNLKRIEMTVHTGSAETFL